MIDPPNARTRVLIVDDSALMRATIRQMLSVDPRIEVVDTAGCGQVALVKINECRPDVITLDVEMPGMDGIELLYHIMRDHPMPVIMLSSATQHGAQRTLDALEAGAMDYVPKPSGAPGASLRDVSELLIEKILASRGANLGHAATTHSPLTPRPIRNVASASAANTHPMPIIAIGISCGGPATLMNVFPEFPADIPPIIVTQHMPAGFTKSFSDRLNRVSTIEVKEAANDDLIHRGRALIAPGDAHITVYGRPDNWRIRLDHREPVCGHRPSADVMFRSVAKTCGNRSIGVIMTGMGNDGADALGTIKAAGGHTVAQNAETCIVYGMPKAAVEKGNVQQIVPVERIVRTIQDLVAAGPGQPVATGRAVAGASA